MPVSVEADRTYEVPEATPCAEGGASVPPAPVVPEPEVPIAPAPEPLPTTNEPAPPVAPEPSSVEAASTALFTATPPPGGFPAPSAPQPAPPAPTEAETSCTEAEATAETASPAATVTVTEYVDAPCMPVTVTETSYVIPFYSLLPLGPGPVIWTSMPNGVPAVPMPTDAAPAPPVSTAPCASSWPQM
ncbi:hypothetical protein H4R18_000409 [Coemansia javaensis]|uniref:Uncharacterized protein n=1 Tax=Coemansia javaensis TaxID=2761396 RepID=A0A9W8HJY9_9FUNG|nr:hypothetical protein H4R18_000409 [Coemansia javaensis]